MIKLFTSALSYAETHYKFKFPWSPLSKPWPEVFIDGPSFCIPGVEPKFYLVVKDADRFPVTIREIEIAIQRNHAEKTSFEKLSDDSKPSTDSKSSPPLKPSSQKILLSWNKSIKENLVFIPLEIDFSPFRNFSDQTFPNLLHLNAKITVENPRGKILQFINGNFPTLLPAPLHLTFLRAPLPYTAPWHAGELHCHSDYSNDPVEFGAPLKVLQEAGQSLGLGYTVCTDHSYDFYYRKTEYMQRTDPDVQFQAYRKEALDLNANAESSMPVLIPGEEVSCGNFRGENVHLLVAGHEKFLPGLGDGGRRWFNNRPDLKIAEVIEKIKSESGFESKVKSETQFEFQTRPLPCFAAHPKVKVGSLERIIFRRGEWHEQDLHDGVLGLQFWNGKRSNDFFAGRKFWIEQLLKGKRLYPIGANDAHGDLNRNIGVKTPLFSLYQNRNHIFGNVRTVVYSEEKTISGIQAALSAGKLFCTDGPFLQIEKKSAEEINSKYLKGETTFVGKVHARSTIDFGALEKVQILGGRLGEKSEFKIMEWDFTNPKSGPMELTEEFTFQAGLHYFRAEALTAEKKFALTAALF